jgi:hypothetical protein
LGRLTRSVFNSNGMNAADCSKMVSAYKTMSYGAGRNAAEYEYATICMALLQVAVAGRTVWISSVSLGHCPTIRPTQAVCSGSHARTGIRSSCGTIDTEITVFAVVGAVM